MFGVGCKWNKTFLQAWYCTWNLIQAQNSVIVSQICIYFFQNCFSPVQTNQWFTIASKVIPRLAKRDQLALLEPLPPRNWTPSVIYHFRLYFHPSATTDLLNQHCFWASWRVLYILPTLHPSLSFENLQSFTIDWPLWPIPNDLRKRRVPWHYSVIPEVPEFISVLILLHLISQLFFLWSSNQVFPKF